MCSCWFGVLICTHTGDRLSLIWKKNHQKLPPNVYILDLLHTCSCRIQSKKTHLNKEQTRACKASHLLEFFLCVGITQATNAQKKKKNAAIKVLNMPICSQVIFFKWVLGGYHTFTIISLSYYWMIENVTWVVIGQSHHLERVQDFLSSWRGKAS